MGIPVADADVGGEDSVGDRDGEPWFKYAESDGGRLFLERYNDSAV